MKTTAYLTAILFLTSCSPYPKGLHDDCRTYLKEFRAQWKRLPNGFYACEDLGGERKHKIFTNAYLFDQEWVKHHHCLSQLSRKEVKRILGEPSMVGKGKNELEHFSVIEFYYFIKDTTCNPQMEYPYVPGAYAYNRLTFAFYYGNQPKIRQQPRLELPCERW
jgi:hypothetical protein